MACRSRKPLKRRFAFCKAQSVLPGGAFSFLGDVGVNTTENQEIRLKDLWVYFLRRWKSILLVTVLLGAALGGWQYFSVKKVHDAGGLTKEEARYEQELAVYRSDLETAQGNADLIMAALDERMAYRNNSLLMNLDPENVWAAEKKYLVSMEEGSATDVLAVYSGVMITDHDEDALLEAFGTSNAGYAGELVSIKADSAENSFTVTVLGSGKETAEKGLAYVSKKIEEAEKQAQRVGGHTLQVLNEGVSVIVLTDLIAKQGRLGDEIEGQEDSLTKARRRLNNVLESMPIKPGNPVVRWAVTGAVLGLLGMCAVYLTMFLKKKKD